jgi:hypothetical protein
MKLEIQLRFESILVLDTIEKKTIFHVCIKITRFPARISNLSDICGSHCRVAEDSSPLVLDTNKQTGLKSHELIQCVHISKRP